LRCVHQPAQDHQILAQKIAQEPLAPAIAARDSQWSDVVKWVTFVLIQAEELNINSNNLSTYQNSPDLEIRNGIE
jgi:general L-amino acid transport system substrate-binding protein